MTSSWQRKALLAIVTAAVCCAALEVAARVRMSMRYGRTTNEYYATTIDPGSGLKVPAPSQNVGRWHINALGFRGDEIALEKPPGAVRIAFLGASTTFCAEASGDSKTWPARVCALLAERFPGKRFECVNSGIPGIGIDECRKLLKHRVAPVRPDVIVVYEATNDLSRDTRTLALERGLIDENPDSRSFLARHSVMIDLLEKNLRLAAREKGSRDGGRLLDFDAATLTEVYRQRYGALLADAKQVAPRVVACTFSTQLRPDQPPDRQREASNTSIYYMPYMDPPRLLAGFAAYNAAIRAAAADQGALLVEAALTIPGDPAHFADSVHFTDAGCETMARCVVDAMLGDDAMKALLAGG